MAYQFNLAKDQRLRGVSNFATWNFLIMTAARRYGMEEFIEEDVISHLKDNSYMLNPNGESKTVKAILKIIEELQLNHGENVNYNEVFTQNRNRNHC